jgi:hypothetical protein
MESEGVMNAFQYGVASACLILVLIDSVAAQPAKEAPPDILVAQLRIQGHVCEKPQSATRDAERSKADMAVWIVKCENATYRMFLVPNMAAKVEKVD